MSYVHCVFFTLKPDAPAADADAQIADARNLLAQIPSVRAIHSGRRDDTMQRDVSVTDYDIGLTVLFADRAGHDLYADHAQHLAYVDRHKAIWSQVRFCDFTAD
jgi:hypothetical protein